MRYAEEAQIQGEEWGVTAVARRGGAARSQLSNHQAVDLQEKDSQPQDRGRASPHSAKRAGQAAFWNRRRNQPERKPEFSRGRRPHQMVGRNDLVRNRRLEGGGEDLIGG